MDHSRPDSSVVDLSDEDVEDILDRLLALLHEVLICLMDLKDKVG